MKYIFIIILININIYARNTSIIPFIQLNYTDIKSEIYYNHNGEYINSLCSELKVKNKTNFINNLKKLYLKNIDSYTLAQEVVKKYQ